MSEKVRNVGPTYLEDQTTIYATVFKIHTDGVVLIGNSRLEKTLLV